MPSPYQIKQILLESLRQDVSRKALNFIAKTKEPEEKEYDIIAVRNVSYLFTPREYEKLAKDWKWATGDEIPVSLEEALDYMENDLTQRDS
tara:strand:+ start:193 stop:465 length:273 start_codon:yes stop_codon:yes gene_type:complete